MNNSELNKLKEKRFEQDAQDGFNLVPGSEEFFANLESPFPAPKTKGGFSSWLFVSLTIVIAAALLFSLNLLYTNSDQHQFALESRQSTEEPVQYSQLTIPSYNGQSLMVEKQSTSNENIIHQSPIANRQSLQRTNNEERRTNNDSAFSYSSHNNYGMDLKLDSLTLPDPPFRYMYPDNQSKYQLRYVKDVLVIDYSDTTPQPKLNPVLSGVPANQEGRMNNPERIPYNSQHTVIYVKDESYLKDIEKPLTFFKKKEYANALQGFKRLLEKNSTDQNALFYGGLSYFYNGQHARALIFFDKLKKMAEPVFEQDVDWYLVKIYTELGMTEKSRAILDSIAHSNSFYRNEAMKTLKHGNR